MACTACGRTQFVDVHHIRTRAAMGPDVWENLLPLCREHHAEMHSRGLVWMCKQYLNIFQAVETRGWTYDDVRKKYIQPENMVRA